MFVARPQRVLLLARGAQSKRDTPTLSQSVSLLTTTLKKKKTPAEQENAIAQVNMHPLAFDSFGRRGKDAAEQLRAASRRRLQRLDAQHCVAEASTDEKCNGGALYEQSHERGATTTSGATVSDAGRLRQHPTRFERDHSRTYYC